MADPELPYAQVVHRVLGVGADTDADADLHPDLSVLAGLTVTFTPQPSVIKWLGAGGPVTHPNKVVMGIYDSQGYLRLTHDSAQEGVWLLASSHEDMVPSGWTYTAKWSLNAIPAVSFSAPPGAVIDLTTVIPVPANPGSQLTDWLAAVEAAQAAQAAAEAAAEAAANGIEERARVFPVAAGSDPSVAYSALAAAGGGELRFLPGAHALTTTLTLDQPVPTLITGRGAVIAPPAAAPAFTCDAGAESTPPVVFDGLAIDGTTAASQIGIKAVDHYGLVIRNTMISNCGTGVLLEDRDDWTESSDFDRLHIDYCTTGIKLNHVAGGRGSFRYASWGMVHVDHVPTGGIGLEITSGADFGGSAIGLLQVHTQNDSVTALSVNGQIFGARIRLHAECYYESPTGAYAIDIGADAAAETAQVMLTIGALGWTADVNNPHGKAFTILGYRDGRTLAAMAPTTQVLRTRIPGDAWASRFAIQADGGMGWGSGAATGDVSWFRSGAAVMRGNFDLDQRRGAFSNPSFESRIDGDGAARLQIIAGGAIRWGDGTNPADVGLYRYVANVLKVDAGDHLMVDGTWNGGMLRLGAYYLWVDSSGDLRIKSSAPSSDTDGTVVGTQS